VRILADHALKCGTKPSTQVSIGLIGQRHRASGKGHTRRQRVGDDAIKGNGWSVVRDCDLVGERITSADLGRSNLRDGEVRATHLRGHEILIAGPRIRPQGISDAPVRSNCIVVTEKMPPKFAVVLEECVERRVFRLNDRPVSFELAKKRSISGVPSAWLGSSRSSYQTTLIELSVGSTAIQGKNWLLKSPRGVNVVVHADW
jgi:hypothetical protein